MKVIPIEPKDVYYLAQSAYEVGVEGAKGYISNNVSAFQVIDQVDIGHVDGQIYRIAKRLFQFLVEPSKLQGSWRVTFLKKVDTNKLWVSIEGTNPESFGNCFAGINNNFDSKNARPITDCIAEKINRLIQKTGLQLEGFSSHSEGVVLGERTILDHFNGQGVWQLGINTPTIPVGENVVMLYSPNDILAKAFNLKGGAYKLPIDSPSNPITAHKLKSCEAMTKLTWSEINQSLKSPSPSIQKPPVVEMNVAKTPQITQVSTISEKADTSDLRGRLVANGAGLFVGYVVTEAFVVKGENIHPYQNIAIRLSAIGVGLLATLLMIYKDYERAPSFIITACATFGGGVVARVATDRITF